MADRFACFDGTGIAYDVTQRPRRPGGRAPSGLDEVRVNRLVPCILAGG